MTLTQESLEKSKSMQRLEEAAAELYKALQAGRETGKALCLRGLMFEYYCPRYGGYHGTIAGISDT